MALAAAQSVEAPRATAVAHDTAAVGAAVALLAAAVAAAMVLAAVTVAAVTVALLDLAVLAVLLAALAGGDGLASGAQTTLASPAPAIGFATGSAV